MGAIRSRETNRFVPARAGHATERINRKRKANVGAIKADKNNSDTITTTNDPKDPLLRFGYLIAR